MQKTAYITINQIAVLRVISMSAANQQLTQVRPNAKHLNAVKNADKNREAKPPDLSDIKQFKHHFTHIFF